MGALDYSDNDYCDPRLENEHLCDEAVAAVLRENMKEERKYFPIKNPIETKNPLQYILNVIVSVVAQKHPEIMTEDLKRTLWKMSKCRTEYLGGTFYGCREHKYGYLVPFSCSCRFCPVCGSFKTQKWLNTAVDVLASIDTPYFFITFTVPSAISQIIKYNKGLLENYFHSVSHDLISWCKERGFIPGSVMIMQTSGDKLNYHVHIHLLITAGGLSVKDETTWIKCPCYPRVALVKTFKALIFRALRKAFKDKEKEFISPPEYIDGACLDEKEFNKFLDKLWHIEWNLDIKQSLKKAEDILGYIARYIKKPPISNRRIIEFDDFHITALFKDYGNDKKKKDEKAKGKSNAKKEKFNRTPQTMYMEYFVLSLLEHFPAKGFRLVRWYGIFSNRNKNELLKKCPQKVTEKEEKKEIKENDDKKGERPYWRVHHEQRHGYDPLVCPVCGEEMIPLIILTRKKIREFNDRFCTFQEVIGFQGYQFYSRN